MYSTSIVIQIHQTWSLLPEFLTRFARHGGMRRSRQIAYWVESRTMRRIESATSGFYLFIFHLHVKKPRGNVDIGVSGSRKLTMGRCQPFICKTYLKKIQSPRLVIICIGQRDTWQCRMRTLVMKISFKIKIEKSVQSSMRSKTLAIHS